MASRHLPATFRPRRVAPAGPLPPRLLLQRRRQPHASGAEPGGERGAAQGRWRAGSSSAGKVGAAGSGVGRAEGGGERRGAAAEARGRIEVAGGQLGGLISISGRRWLTSGRLSPPFMPRPPNVFAPPATFVCSSRSSISGSLCSTSGWRRRREDTNQRWVPVAALPAGLGACARRQQCVWPPSRSRPMATLPANSVSSTTLPPPTHPPGRHGALERGVCRQAHHFRQPGQPGTRESCSAVAAARAAGRGAVRAAAAVRVAPQALQLEEHARPPPALRFSTPQQKRRARCRWSTSRGGVGPPAVPSVPSHLSSSLFPSVPSDCPSAEGPHAGDGDERGGYPWGAQEGLAPGADRLPQQGEAATD